MDATELYSMKLGDILHRQIKGDPTSDAFYTEMIERVPGGWLFSGTFVAMHPEFQPSASGRLDIPKPVYCDLADCSNSNTEMFGDNHYCPRHMPVCGIAGCGEWIPNYNRTAGRPICIKHTPTQRIVLDEPAKPECYVYTCTSLAAVQYGDHRYCDTHNPYTCDFAECKQPGCTVKSPKIVDGPTILWLCVEHRTKENYDNLPATPEPFKLCEENACYEVSMYDIMGKRFCEKHFYEYKPPASQDKLPHPDDTMTPPWQDI